MKYLVDTSYWLALILAMDQNHIVTEAHWKHLQTLHHHLVTTSFVLDEAVAYLNSRGKHSTAVQLGHRLLNGTAIEFIHIDEPLFLAGWNYFEQHQDKRYSLTDCISFVVMQQYGIQTALTFDQHFIQAGFQREPLP